MSQPTPTQELVAKDLHGTDQPNWIHASEKGRVTPSVYSWKEPVANWWYGGFFLTWYLKQGARK